jgi:flagellar biosynthesis protein FlhF
MNIQRFTAATSREALAKARATFGDGTLILSNRPTENGVEVVATTEDSLAVLDQDSGSAGQSGARSAPQQQAAPNYRDVASKVEEDADQLAMSTLSFQDYVRERMARKRHEAAQETPAPRAAEPVAARPAFVPPEVKKAAPAPTKPLPVRKATPIVMSTPVSTPMPQGIATELQAMKALIEERFDTLNWLGQARQNPIHSGLMLKMIRAGYSPTLSRAILERLPEGSDAAHAMRWVMDILERNLATDEHGPALHEEGGIFALIGATGVGKTTTAAKLAGLCALRHGPGSVGLISLDTYRVGAQEQLRAYGKMLGVVAHLAHDRAALQDLLGLLAGKKMVLIDTTGLAPRDPRKREMMELLDLPDVKRLLVLNASGHGDTLDDTVSSFKSTGTQEVIFSKMDEAVKLGPAIDVSIRHQLMLRGITTGQQVPEDWEAANAAKLVRASMRATGNSPYDPKASDLGFIFSHANDAYAGKGMLNA